MFYGIIQTFDIPTSDKHGEQNRRMSKPTADTKITLNCPRTTSLTSSSSY
jgi:hypothetical protein